MSVEHNLVGQTEQKLQRDRRKWEVLEATVLHFLLLSGGIERIVIMLY